MARQSKLAVAIAKANGTYRVKGKQSLDRRRKDSHHTFKGEVDAHGEWGSVGSRSIPESRMIAAVVEDAVRVACKGHPDRWWDGRKWYVGYSREAWEELYLDTLEWLFVEDEPDSPFSFHWCIGALNAQLGLNYDADTVRNRVIDLNVVPQGDIQCVISSLP